MARGSSGGQESKPAPTAHRVKVALWLAFLAACGGHSDAEVDELREALAECEARQLEAATESLEETMAESDDMVGESPPETTTAAPVTVTRIEVTSERRHKEVQVWATNGGDKPIDAIELEVTLKDSFGDPVGRRILGETLPVRLQFQADDPGEYLVPGGEEQSLGVYTVRRHELANQGEAVVKRVHFADGSVWP